MDSEKAFDSFSSCLALAGEELSHVENDNSMIATRKGKHARKREEGRRGGRSVRGRTRERYK